MTTSTAVRRRALRRFIPPQHGAWAMLLLPWLAGVLVAGFRWPHLPLLGAWLTGYLFSYFLFQAVKTRRPERVRTQLVAYGTPTVALGALVLAVCPRVLWYAPVFAALLAVNLGFAARRDERALLNDLASVAQSCLMVVVCGTVADVPPADLVPAFVAVTAYFAGTVLYVKTMIRERGSTGYYRASVAYHVAVLLAAAWWHRPGAVVFAALLLARAALFPRRRMTPKRVGVVEIVACVLLLLLVAVG